MSQLAIACALALSGSSLHAWTRPPTPTGTVAVSRPSLVWSIRADSATRPETSAWLDGRPIPSRYDTLEGRVVATLTTDLRPGTYRARMQVRYGRYSPFEENWTFQVVRGPSRGQTSGDASALSQVNLIRRQHGLSQLDYGPALQWAGNDHAEYLAINRVLSHEQTPGLPAFTGASPRERVGRYGGTHRVVEGVLRRRADAPVALRKLFDAPYHRAAFLEPHAKAVGYAERSDHHVFLAAFERPRGQVVVSPADGMEFVPTSWSDREIPDPLRGTGYSLPVGYIPTFWYFNAPGETLAISSMTLSTPDGRRVEGVVRHSGNDPHLRSPMGAMLVPRRPLRADTTYVATVRYSVSGSPWQTKSWSFSTVPTFRADPGSQR